jgi:hypothetical protein
MQKWIRYAEKLLKHWNYIEIITQIYQSIAGFLQMSPKKMSFLKTFNLPQ